MVRFPNTSIELWEYHESHDSHEYYQEPIVKYKLHSTVPADMQPIKPDEEDSEQGKQLKGEYHIIVDHDVSVNDKMIIREVGKSATYSIIGEIEINNHLRRLRHKRFRVKHHRIDHELGEE